MTNIDKRLDEIEADVRRHYTTAQRHPKLSFDDADFALRLARLAGRMRPKMRECCRGNFQHRDYHSPDCPAAEYDEIEREIGGGDAD